jgi:hypothetical protein
VSLAIGHTGTCLRLPIGWPQRLDGRTNRNMPRTSRLAAHPDAARTNRQGRTSIMTVAGTLVLAGLLAILAPASPANAGGGTPPGHTGMTIKAGTFQIPVTVVAERPATTSATAANPYDTCRVVEYGYTGYVPCDLSQNPVKFTTPGAFDWGNGNIEYFVIGTDWQIWHIWKNSGGWKPLGGHALEVIWNYSIAYSAGKPPTGNMWVESIGTNGNVWCRDWPWTADWWECKVQ